MKLMGMLFKLSWVVSTLAAINVGLTPCGYDFFKMGFMMSNPTWVAPVQYFILAMGVVSLGSLVMMCVGGGHCCGCGCASCSKPQAK